MGNWTHFDEAGRPVMVDVSKKDATERTAVAEGWIDLPETVFAAVRDRAVKKGDPLAIAELGGIMGAKRTPDLIPLCHAIRLDSVRVECALEAGDGGTGSLRIVCRVTAKDVTGVEMEALTGVSTAALVFYDMCKGLDKGMIVRDIRLLEKSGGKSGNWRAADSHHKSIVEV